MAINFEFEFIKKKRLACELTGEFLTTSTVYCLYKQCLSFCFTPFQFALIFVIRLSLSVSGVVYPLNGFCHGSNRK